MKNTKNKRSRASTGNTGKKNLKEEMEVKKIDEIKTWKSGTRKVGENGEKAAEVYFRNKGHTIVDKNYRKLRGEIDLITLQNNVLHFVEVKTSVQHLPVFSMPDSTLVFNDRGRGVYKRRTKHPIKNKNSPSVLTPISAQSSFFTSLNRENLHRNKIKKVVRTAEIYRAEKNISDEIETQVDGLLVTLIYDQDQIQSVKVQYIPHIDRMIEW